MTAKKNDASENLRKRKRIVPTRAAGTPAFENPADELFAAAFANRNKREENPQETILLPSTHEEISRPQLSDEPSTSNNVDGLPSTLAESPSTKDNQKANFDGKPSINEKESRPQSKPQTSTKNDRHNKNLARFDNRIKHSLVREIKTFCLKFDIAQKEFVEMAAVHFMEVWTAKFDKIVDGKTAQDDRSKMIMWKSAPNIINLYRAYNFENKWKFNDDEAAQKYNDVDLRIIELGIIETQFNSGFKKINSFGYYKNQIDLFIEQKLGEEMLIFLTKHYREKWQRATGKVVDISFLESQ